jgi:signal transduction histidine kinase
VKSKPTGSKRNRIVLIYVLGVVIPGLILGFLAFRGIRNDQALREKQTRNEIQILVQEFFRRLDSKTINLPDSLSFLIFSRQVGQPPQIIHNHLIYFPDGYLKTLPPESESFVFKQATDCEFRDKEVAKALVLYYRVFSESADSIMAVKALNGVARIYYQKNQKDSAVAIYQRIAENYGSTVIGDHLPASALALTELIRINRETGNVKAAEQWANRLVRFLLQPSVAFERSYFEFLSQNLSKCNPQPDSGLMAGLRNEKSKTDFLISIIENSGTLFNGESGKRKYLDSEKFPALFIQENQPSGIQIGKVIDLNSFAKFHLPAIFKELDNENAYHWNILTEYGQYLFPMTADTAVAPLQVTFPVNYPPWKISISPKPQSGWQILVGTSQGLFVFVFAFITLLMIAGLVFMMYTLNQEMKLSKMKSDFISNVSHEFKTPLTSIRHMTEIMYLKRIQSEPRKEEYLQSMLEQCDHLGHLIENILDFSKIEEDIKNYRFEWHNPDALLNDLIRLYRSRITETDFELVYEAEIKPPMLYIDKDAMLQVFYNLIDNAYKYSAGSRRIEISLYLRQEGKKAKGQEGKAEDKRNKEEVGFVVVSVRDFGLGIPEKDLPRIFERFYRGDRLRTEGIKGSGIGLTIVKRIVEAHHGQLHVESETGKGSVFTVHLPIDQNQYHDKDSDH